jgi:XTP/dITP diphosphohydrolase
LPKGFEKTLAEMNLEEKNKISMRRNALEKLKEYLKSKN